MDNIYSILVNILLDVPQGLDLLFLPRPIREVLNSGILSVRPSVRGVAAKRCVKKG